MTSDLRVLFVLKWRASPYCDDPAQTWGEYGCGYAAPFESGVCNSARMAAHMLERMGVATAVVHVVDSNAIEAQVAAFDATHVIIEAFWVPPAKFDELGRVCPRVRFIVRNHSETPFLANEGIGFDWSLQYLTKPNVVVAPNAPRMVDEMRFLAQRQAPTLSAADVADHVAYLPNYYGLREEPTRTLDRGKAVVDVGCFGAIRPLKNPVTQAIGAMRFAAALGKPLRFHINGARVEMGGAPVLKSLIALFADDGADQLVQHAWRPHDAFLSLLLGMDLVTQVSFSETFNIVAADALAEGVPLVTSEEVPWSAPAMRADPSSSADIAAVMARLYRMKLNSPELNPGLEGLRDYNREARRRWAAFFGLDDHAAIAAPL